MAKIAITDDDILYVLGRMSVPMSLEWLCDELGVKRGRAGRYSRTAAAKYTAISAALQRLKRAARVEYVKGRGAGWRIAKAKRKPAAKAPRATKRADRIERDQTRHDVAASVARHAEMPTPRTARPNWCPEHRTADCDVCRPARKAALEPPGRVPHAEDQLDLPAIAERPTGWGRDLDRIEYEADRAAEPDPRDEDVVTGEHGAGCDKQTDAAFPCNCKPSAAAPVAAINATTSLPIEAPGCDYNDLMGAVRTIRDEAIRLGVTIDAEKILADDRDAPAADECRLVCPGCDQEIDEETCHCGQFVADHNAYSGHSPVPMGCMCHQQRDGAESPPDPATKFSERARQLTVPAADDQLPYVDVAIAPAGYVIRSCIKGELAGPREVDGVSLWPKPETAGAALDRMCDALGLDPDDFTVVPTYAPPRDIKLLAPAGSAGTITLRKGDSAWHDGPGWYYTIDDYPDEGSCGAFASREVAEEHARCCGHTVGESPRDPVTTSELRGAVQTARDEAVRLGVTIDAAEILAEDDEQPPRSWPPNTGTPEVPWTPFVARVEHGRGPEDVEGETVRYVLPDDKAAEYAAQTGVPLPDATGGES